MLIWGVHVHVRVSSAHKVMPIISSLLNHYPHLLALSASSPFWAGETPATRQPGDDVQQLPAAGPAVSSSRPGGSSSGSCTTRDHRHHRPHQQKCVGTSGRRHIWAPSVRIFDRVSSIRELSALVALTHCLIVDLDRRLEAGSSCR